MKKDYQQEMIHIPLFINKYTSTKYHKATLSIDHTLKGEDGGQLLRPRTSQSKVLIHMTVGTTSPVNQTN